MEDEDGKVAERLAEKRRVKSQVKGEGDFEDASIPAHDDAVTIVSRGEIQRMSTIVACFPVIGCLSLGAPSLATLETLFPRSNRTRDLASSAIRSFLQFITPLSFPDYTGPLYRCPKLRTPFLHHSQSPDSSVSLGAPELGSRTKKFGENPLSLDKRRLY